jgi:hypothetical protein
MTSRRLAAETLGTALLLAAIVGSGIMAEKLTGDTALALLCNSLAAGAMLVSRLMGEEVTDLSRAGTNDPKRTRRQRWRAPLQRPPETRQARAAG